MTSTETKYKLTYFNARGGGEIIRLIFAVGNVAYEDERIEKETWPERKSDMPMKSLPVLTITDGRKETIYCQSGAIAKYLAKKFGMGSGIVLMEETIVSNSPRGLRDLRVKDFIRIALASKSALSYVTTKLKLHSIEIKLTNKLIIKRSGINGSSDEETLVIDEVYDSVGDVRRQFIQIHFEADENRKKEAKEKLTNELLPNFNCYIQRRRAQFGNSGYLIGDKLTLADLAVFNLVDSSIMMGMEELWTPYPTLLDHRKQVMENSDLMNWLNKRPKTAL